MSDPHDIRTAYVAGPMSRLPLFNFPAFDAATARLQAAGWAVISPADLDREVGFDEHRGTLDGFDMQAAQQRDVDAIMSLDPQRGDAIAMLPGWERSTGAKAEHALAVWRGLGVIDAETLQPLTPAASPVAARVNSPEVFAVAPLATHRCKVCGARWKLWEPMEAHPDDVGSWTLVSLSCGKCCDNVPMGDQIEPLTPAASPVADHHPAPPAGTVRTFSTGATRDSNAGKLCVTGFLSPLVVKRYSEYMHVHRLQTDGSLRAADNWQHGMPLDVLEDSAGRHWLDFWLHHRGLGDVAVDPDMESVICALMFNLQGYLFELLVAKLGRRPRVTGAKPAA